jgi:predicted site-specific integrase-resolvase
MSYKKELITAQVLAEALDLSVETVWRYTRENKIPYIVIGSKNYRYDLDDVMRSLTEPRVQEKEYKEEEINQKLTYQDYLLLP